MTQLNIKGLSDYSRKFDSLHIPYPYTSSFIHNCSGEAMLKINEVMSKFDQIGCAVDQLYVDSGTYFGMVANNLATVEKTNSVTGTGLGDFMNNR